MKKNSNTTSTGSSDEKVVTNPSGNLNELLKKIKEGEVYCTYCAELATELNSSNMPVCGIPGNH